MLPRPRAQLALLLLLAPARVSGQPAGPQVFLGGTLDLAYASDRKGLPEVNQLIRGDSPFDVLRLRLDADVVINGRLTLFNQLLIDPSASSSFNFATFLRSYLRFTVFRKAKADLHLQAGRIPTPFGAYSPRSYSERSPLVGIPLLYHYFSSLRSNQLPANNADLLAHRGEGLAQGFGGFRGGGSRVSFSGLPMIYDACWDLGVSAQGSAGRLEYLLAVTQGTLSSPRINGRDDNGGKQVAARVGVVPLTGLVLGASIARGPYLDSDLQGSLSAPGARIGSFDQVIYGFDLEYGVRHLQLQAELAANRWESPNIRDAAGGREDLTNLAWYVEAKYSMLPGLFAAVRHDRIRFGEIDDGTGAGRRVPWDYGLRSWEWGVGYHLTDRVIAKLVRQDHDSDRPGAPPEHLWAVQLSTSF